MQITRSMVLAASLFVVTAACSDRAGGQAADAGADTGGAGGDGGGGPAIAHPNPIISRGTHAFSSPPGGAAVIDGNYHNGGWNAGAPTATTPSWVAIQLAAGPSRVLVSWDDGGTYNYQDPTSATVYGLPAAYHIDVSPDSTNGSDGTWTAAVTVDGNKVRTRAHAIDFAGQSWVKLVITAAPANESSNGVQIGEIDVHDISATGGGLPDDTWFFMGDSITAFAYDRAAAHQPSFAAQVHTAVPAYFPAMINGGIGGEKSGDGLARLSDALSLNDAFHFFVLGYGTNDAANGQVPIATFQNNLQSMIDMVKAVGHEAIIPHIPFAGDGSHAMVPSYNAAIDMLTESNGLHAGADLYAFLMARPEDFTCPPCGGGRTTDNLHPNDVGLQALNTQWADAVRPLYP